MNKFTLFFTLIFSVVYSQNSVFLANYDYYNSADASTKIPCKLLYQNQMSRFILQYEEYSNTHQEYSGLTYNVSIYKDFSANEMLGRAIEYKETAVVQDTIIDYKWQLLDSTQVINNLRCKLAKTTFRQHDWLVWYTTEIPISNGPWKLHGLPGLILQAEGKNKLYTHVFTLKDFQFIDPNSENSEKPKNPYKTNTFSRISFTEFLDYTTENNMNRLKYSYSQKEGEKDPNIKSGSMCLSSLEFVTCYP